MIRLEPMRPGETRDYLHDWSAFLSEDTIASEVTAGEGVTVDAHAIEEGDKAVQFTFSAETPGVGRIAHTITTAGGQVETELFTLLIANAEEPVSVAEAKQHLRIVDNDSEDALIAGYIRTAREWVEGYTGHVLVRREFTEYHDSFTEHLDLRRTPIISTEELPLEVNVTPAGGEAAAFTGFTASLDRRPARLTRTTTVSGDVAVTYVAGYAEGEVPERAVQAILVLVVGMFMNRGGTYDDALRAAEDICGPLRLPVLA